MNKHFFFIFIIILATRAFAFGIPRINEYSIVIENQKKGLADQKGKIVIPVEYEDLGWSHGNADVQEQVIGYKVGNFWGLINTSNVKLTDPQYLSLLPLSKNILIASRYDSYRLNEEFGLLTNSGKVLIGFNYSSLLKAGNLLIASLKSNGILSYGLIDSRGKEVVPFNYYSIDCVDEKFFILTRKDGRKELADAAGNKMTDQLIDELDRLSEDHYLVNIKGRYGLINSDGNIIANPDFSDIMFDKEGHIDALPGQSWLLLDLENQVVSNLPYQNIIPLESGFYKTSTNNFNFIVDRLNTRHFSIKGSEIDILNDSLALFRKNNRYGVINYLGEEIIQPTYDSILISGNRLFLKNTTLNQQGWRIADLFGFDLNKKDFDWIERLNEEYLAVYKNNFWGVVDNHGKEIIFPKYDSVHMAIQDRFLVDLFGETGILKTNGEWDVYPQKGELHVFPDKSYLISSYYGSHFYDPYGNVQLETDYFVRVEPYGFIEEDFEGKLGLINRNFEKVLPVEYEFIAPLIGDSVFLYKNVEGWGLINGHQVQFDKQSEIQKVIGYNEGYIMVMIDGQYGFIDLNGKLRIANRYHEAKLYHEGLANVMLMNKWGAIDMREKIVIQPFYDFLGPVSDGMAIAAKDGRYGLIDSDGKTRVNFEYDSIYAVHEGGYVCLSKKKAGLINNKGELSFYPKFDYIKDLGNGYVMAERKNKFGVFTSDGVTVIPMIYDSMQYDPYNKLIIASENPQWISIGSTTEK